MPPRSGEAARLPVTMKETHLFYAPDIAENPVLPQEEAQHAVRVLRMQEGDSLLVTDGKGHFHEAVLALASPKRCGVEIVRTYAVPQPWRGAIHLAVAPTKSMDRMEWLAEKATEIGLDSLAFLDCANSERRVVKTERVEKIVVAATKQSHKAFKPEVRPMTAFRKFVRQPFDGEKYIAHCYRDMGGNAPCGDYAAGPQGRERFDGHDIPALSQVVGAEGGTLVLVGPEGDFGLEEVRMAEAAGFRSVSLGRSRLRTETAALVAVHLMNIAKSGLRPEEPGGGQD